MKKNGQFSDKQDGEIAQAPRQGQSRWIQCKNYRCLGILDRDGKWRSFSTGKELTDIVEVLPE